MQDFLSKYVTCGSAYFKDVCTPVVEITGWSNLGSALRGDIFVPERRT